MSSATDQNSSVQSMSRQGRSLARSVRELSRPQNLPEARDGLAPSEWSAGPKELMELHEEWVRRHAELLQGVLSKPCGEPDEQVAIATAGANRLDDLASGESPTSDYLRLARQINADCLKSMAEVAPLAEGQAKDQMRFPARPNVDAKAPSNLFAQNAQPSASDYREIRDKLKSGDIIVASKGNMKSFNGFLSLLVRVVTASSYSHVGIVVKLGKRCFVVEATPPVVRLYPLSQLDSFYVIKMEKSLSREDEDRLFRYVGLPYSDWNSFASYFTRRPLDNGKLQCAQLVSSFYNWPNLLRPEQVVRYAQEDLGKKMVFVR